LALIAIFLTKTIKTVQRLLKLHIKMLGILCRHSVYPKTTGHQHEPVLRMLTHAGNCAWMAE